MRLVVKVKSDLRRKALDQAIARGLNEGGDKVRTQVRRALKTKTNVKAYKSITSRTAEAGKGYNRAAPGRLVYAIVASRKAIPIVEFPLTVIKGKGGGVDARSWGVDHLFKRSFAVNGKYKARLGKSRFPIRSLLGPNLGKELVSGEIVAIWRAAVDVEVVPRVINQLAKALS